MTASPWYKETLGGKQFLGERKDEGLGVDPGDDQATVDGKDVGVEHRSLESALEGAKAKTGRTPTLPPTGHVPLKMWQRVLLLNVVPENEPFIVKRGKMLYVNTGHPKYRIWLMIFMRGATEAMQRMFTNKGKEPTNAGADKES